MTVIMQELDYSSGKCISCNNRLIISGVYIVCTNCGLVHGISNIVTRNHGYYLRFNFLEALGTCIDSPKRKTLFDSKGKILSPSRGLLYGRLRKIDRYEFYKDIMDYYRFFRIAEKMCSYLHLNTVILNQIIHLFKKYLKEYKDKTGNKVVLLATCFYIVIKNNKIPIKISKLSKAFVQHGHRINQKLIFQTILNLNIKIKRFGHVEDYIEQYISRIQNIKGFDERLRRKKPYMNKDEYFLKMRHIVYQVTKISIINKKGHQPDIMAAAIIYFVARLIDKKYNGRYILTQNMISNTLGLSLYAIRDLYVRTFRQHLKRLVNK